MWHLLTDKSGVTTKSVTKIRLTIFHLSEHRSYREVRKYNNLSRDIKVVNLQVCSKRWKALSVSQWPENTYTYKNVSFFICCTCPCAGIENVFCTAVDPTAYSAVSVYKRYLHMSFLQSQLKYRCSHTIVYMNDVQFSCWARVLAHLCRHPLGNSISLQATLLVLYTFITSFLL